MTFTRDHAFSIMLIASIVAMMNGPLLAAPPHEICVAMHHGCNKVDALSFCCCGDRSETNPSRVPSGRGDAVSSPHAVAAVVVAFDMPAIAVVVVREGLTPLARPPDLRILFSDLRI